MRAHNFRDLTGQRFGKLTVVAFTSVVNRKSQWSCLCDCGTEKTITGADLSSGKLLLADAAISNATKPALHMGRHHTVNVIQSIGHFTMHVAAAPYLLTATTSGTGQSA